MCVSFEMKNFWNWTPYEGALATIGQPFAKNLGLKVNTL